MRLSNIKIKKADFETREHGSQVDSRVAMFDDAISNGHWALKLATLNRRQYAHFRLSDTDSFSELPIKRITTKTWDSAGPTEPAPKWIITPYLYDDEDSVGYGLVRLLESEDTGTLSGIQDRYLRIIDAKIGDVLYSHEHRVFQNAPLITDSVCLFMSYRIDAMPPFPKKHKPKKAEAQVEAAASV